MRELVFTATAEGRVWWVKHAHDDLPLKMIPDSAVTHAYAETCWSGAPQDDDLMPNEKMPALQDTTYFQVADTLRTIVAIGLEGAADGKPYLTGRPAPWSSALPPVPLRLRPSTHIVTSVFGAAEAERWDAPLITLPDHDAVRDYLVARYVPPDQADRSAAKVSTPATITKRGAFIRARK